MCFRDVLNELGRRGLAVTEGQVRWAIRTGKVARPALDGSLRFDFQNEHIERLAEIFAKPGEAVAT